MKQFLRYAAMAVAAWFIGLYLWVALARIWYPYELEWMEGGSLEQVGRLLAGQPLYVKPSIEFIPYIYTPIYFYLAAAVSSVAGESFTSLRLVSVLSSIASFGLIFVLVRRESGRAGSGFIAAGLFAATFRLGGAWFDLARVDSLFVALLLAAVVVLRMRPTAGGSALAAVLLALSFLTKQPAALMAAPLAVAGAAASRGWNRVVFPLVFAGVVSLATLGFDAASSGWYSYYTMVLPWQHEIERKWLLEFWSYDLFRPLAIASILMGVFLYRLANRRVPELTFYLVVFGALIAMAWLSRLHSGGYDNVLMPLHAGLAIGGALGVASLRGTRLEAIATAACVIQFAWLAYAPAALIPTARDRAAGDRLVTTIGSLTGDVLVPMHGYLAERAGKRAFAGGMAFDDVRRGREGALVREVEFAMGEALREGRFGAVILDGPDWGFDEEIAASYEHAGQLFDAPGVFMTRSGMPTRPQELYVARRRGR